RDLKTYSPDVWVKAAYDRWLVEAEIVAQIGAMQVVTGAADPVTMMAPTRSYDIRKYGGAGRLTWRGLEGKLRLGGETGRASGPRSAHRAADGLRRRDQHRQRQGRRDRPHHPVPVRPGVLAAGQLRRSRTRSCLLRRRVASSSRPSVAARTAPTPSQRTAWLIEPAARNARLADSATATS